MTTGTGGRLSSSEVIVDDRNPPHNVLSFPQLPVVGSLCHEAMNDGLFLTSVSVCVWLFWHTKNPVELLQI